MKGGAKLPLLGYLCSDILHCLFSCFVAISHEIELGFSALLELQWFYSTDLCPPLASRNQGTSNPKLQSYDNLSVDTSMTLDNLHLIARCTLRRFFTVAKQAATYPSQPHQALPISTTHY